MTSVDASTHTIYVCTIDNSLYTLLDLVLWGILQREGRDNLMRREGRFGDRLSGARFIGDVVIFRAVPEFGFGLARESENTDPS